MSLVIKLVEKVTVIVMSWESGTGGTSLLGPTSRG